MRQLETRFYSLDELAEAIGRKRDDHFAGNAKNDLSKWGYSFIWQNRRGVQITRIPETAQECLSEMMLRHFQLDVQVDVYAFACFMFLLLNEDGFDSMPWAVRAEDMRDWFGVEVAERTLRRWTQRLIKAEAMRIDKYGAVWRTSIQQGIKTREPVKDDDPNYIEYIKYRNELIEDGIAQNLSRAEAWCAAFGQLWKELHCCYYKCGRIDLNALNEELDDILKWVEEICWPALEGENRI